MTRVVIFDFVNKYVDILELRLTHIQTFIYNDYITSLTTMFQHYYSICNMACVVTYDY
jgi:hypothetical protein